MKKAVIIIPTYNEVGNIELTVSQLFQVFKEINNWEMHLLIVDDNSPDGTHQLVKKLQEKQPNIHLLLNQTKTGLGTAYLRGMTYAFVQLEAAVVFEFDADLSHDPTMIPAFLQKIEEGNQLVIGSRYISGGSIPSNWGIHCLHSFL
jgi:dolichol-phosphate mannosyltransferase